MKTWIYLLGFLITMVVLCRAEAGQRDLFPDPTLAERDLAAALTSAAAVRRRVIVDFGGNWCTDCHVLEAFLHDPVNEALLRSSYVVVHVNVGRLDKNLALATRFKIPLQKGVPALAVLEADGSLLYSQHAGEFRDMRRLDSASVTEFLRRWQPPPG